jgi:predicted TPR repeat methyltransferase
VRLQLAQAAETAGDATTAIAAYKQFIKLAPDDASVPQAKARIKALEKQLAGSSATTQG